MIETGDLVGMNVEGDSFQAVLLCQISDQDIGHREGHSSLRSSSARNAALLSHRRKVQIAGGQEGFFHLLFFQG